MELIPDTGGGLSGYITHFLWYLYRRFPFLGSWDWVFLILLLAIVFGWTTRGYDQEW
jgi:hypothetical protein